MSHPIVFDEWLVEDLLGKNGVHSQNETFDLLLKVYDICDKILILKGSKFEKKCYDLMNKSQSDIKTIQMGKFFYNTFYTNSNKVIFVEDEELPMLSKQLRKLTPDDDNYLIRLHLKKRTSFIVTSDGRLKERLASKPKILIFMRDDFISSYGN